MNGTAPLTESVKPDRIPQDQFMMIVWKLAATFVNESKTGSLTLHFVEGRFSTSEEKITKRF